MAGKHAIIKDDGGKFTIEPCEVTNRLLQNGKAVVAKQALNHNDRWRSPLQKDSQSDDKKFINQMLHYLNFKQLHCTLLNLYILIFQEIVIYL